MCLFYLFLKLGLQELLETLHILKALVTTLRKKSLNYICDLLLIKLHFVLAVLSQVIFYHFLIF